MQVVNVILVNVSMMEIHSGNLEQSALIIKIVPAGFIISTKNLKFPGQCLGIFLRSVSVEWVTVKMRHGSVT